MAFQYIVRIENATKPEWRERTITASDMAVAVRKGIDGAKYAKALPTDSVQVNAVRVSGVEVREATVYVCRPATDQEMEARSFYGFQRDRRLHILHREVVTLQVRNPNPGIQAVLDKAAALYPDATIALAFPVAGRRQMGEVARG